MSGLTTPNSLDQPLLAGADRFEAPLPLPLLHPILARRQAWTEADHVEMQALPPHPRPRVLPPSALLAS
eukprot:9816798-Karenia_brevis.AAC.1